MAKAKEISKDQEIAKETERLSKLFENISEDKKSLVKNLIQNAAFISITLRDMQKEINENGVTEVYANGPNQSCVHASATVQTYNKLVGTFNQISKTLVSLLPVGETKRADDLGDFLRS